MLEVAFGYSIEQIAVAFIAMDCVPNSRPELEVICRVFNRMPPKHARRLSFVEWILTGNRHLVTPRLNRQ